MADLDDNLNPKQLLKHYNIVILLDPLSFSPIQSVAGDCK